MTKDISGIGPHGPVSERFMRHYYGAAKGGKKRDMGYIVGPDSSFITCLTCGFTSYNPNDVANRYCGHCHIFHED